MKTTYNVHSPHGTPGPYDRVRQTGARFTGVAAVLAVMTMLGGGEPALGQEKRIPPPPPAEESQKPPLIHPSVANPKPPRGETRFEQEVDDLERQRVERRVQGRRILDALDRFEDGLSPDRGRFPDF